MTKSELRKLIQDIIQEYSGTGDMSSTGLTSDDGNDVTSQRSRWDTEEDEMEFYNNTGAPYGGAEGQHTRGMEPNFPKGNPNRTRYTRF